MVDLVEDFAKFRFLCNTPTMAITPALEEEECLICKGPYQNDGWQLGQTVHRPVGLRCGHVPGFQCLALWMLSTNFDNHCPLCRTRIYDPSIAREPLSPALALSFARLEVLAVTAHNGISGAQKRWLLKSIKQSLQPLQGDTALDTTTENIDRIVVVWEEFLHKICKKTVRTDKGNPMAIGRHQVIANQLFGSWDQITRCFLPDSPERACWVSFYSVSFGLAVWVILWIRCVGGEEILIEMLGSSTALFYGCIVGLPVSISRVPLGYKIISSFATCGLMSILLVDLAAFFLGGTLSQREVYLMLTTLGLERRMN